MKASARLSPLLAQNLVDAGDDAGGVQTVMGQKLGSVAGLAKAGHAQTAHATGLLYCQQLRDREPMPP